MKILNVLLLSTILLSTSTLYAQNEKVTPAYGDNPNLLVVLAHKTANTVQNTVKKVGAVTERSIEKMRPTVGEAWENTRDYSQEQADLALNNTRQGINTAVQKVNETKAQMIGTPTRNVPIIQGMLSQSSTTPVVQQNTVAPISPPQTHENLNPIPTVQQTPPTVQPPQQDALNDTITVKSLPVHPTPMNSVPTNIVPETEKQMVNTVKPVQQPENPPVKKSSYQFDLNAELDKELATP